MLIKRRTFLQTGSLASASFLLPKFLKALVSGNAVPHGNKVLVVLQLSGGNDGLNTVIPVRNDVYYKSRPGLGIKKESALLLTDDTGIHPALTAFKGFFDDGSLGILNAVGYPNPDRSHFRSMDIWQTATDSDVYEHSGWVGRFVDAQCSGCDRPTQAIEIDDVLSVAMKGKKRTGVALTNPQVLFNAANDPYFRTIAGQHHDHEHEKADYLYKTLSDSLNSAEYIYKQSKLRPSSKEYPATELGRNLKTIASLIFSDVNTKVYYLSLGSFDTHINQSFQQNRLFTELNYAMESFVQDLKSNNRFEDVMVMTFSEFGRRVSQNASGGTDHGAANNMFFVSGGLKQRGLINEMPDLHDLLEGDIKHQIDFKSVYATMLNKWLDADDNVILGKKYPTLSFI